MRTRYGRVLAHTPPLRTNRCERLRSLSWKAYSLQETTTLRLCLCQDRFKGLIRLAAQADWNSPEKRFSNLLATSGQALTPALIRGEIAFANRESNRLLASGMFPAQEGTRAGAKLGHSAPRKRGAAAE